MGWGWGGVGPGLWGLGGVGRLGRGWVEGICGKQERGEREATAVSGAWMRGERRHWRLCPAAPPPSSAPPHTYDITTHTPVRCRAFTSRTLRPSSCLTRAARGWATVRGCIDAERGEGGEGGGVAGVWLDHPGVSVCIANDAALDPRQGCHPCMHAARRMPRHFSVASVGGLEAQLVGSGAVRGNVPSTAG